MGLEDGILVIGRQLFSLMKAYLTSSNIPRQTYQNLNALMSWCIHFWERANLAYPFSNHKENKNNNNCFRVLTYY